MIERDREVLKEVLENKIKNVKHNAQYEWIRVEGIVESQERIVKRRSQKVIAMVRC